MVHSMVLSFSHHSAFPIHGFNQKCRSRVHINIECRRERQLLSTIWQPGATEQSHYNRFSIEMLTFDIVATPTVLQDSAVKIVDVQGLLVHA
jgi:hypothetical protein